MTFNFFYKGKGFEELKIRDTHHLHFKNNQVSEVKKSFNDLKNRLNKLNTLFQKNTKDTSKFQSSMTYSKNASNELLGKRYKSGKNSPRKLDFDTNYEKIGKKITNLKKNFNLKEKILNLDKEKNVPLKAEKDDSSDINLDEITDSIISLTKNNQPETCNSLNKKNNFYLDIDMTYLKDKENNFTPRTNGSKFVNQFQEKALLNDSYKLLSKISSSKSDYNVEKSIIPDIKCSNSKENDIKINECNNYIHEKDSIPTNPNKNIYKISQNIFNNINCFSENKKEKTPTKYTKSNDYNTEMDDLDFEVSELTANQKADDSIEVTRKRSLKSTRKFKKESLIIQNENVLSIISLNENNNHKEIKNDNVKSVDMKVIENLNNLEIEGKKDIHEVEVNIKNEIILDKAIEEQILYNESTKNDLENNSEPTPIEKDNFIDIVWEETKQSIHDSQDKSLNQTSKTLNENKDNSNHILIINDQKKKVNFLAKRNIINVKENRRVINNKCFLPNSINSFKKITLSNLKKSGKLSPF